MAAGDDRSGFGRSGFGPAVDGDRLPARHASVRRLVGRLPRPFRFLGVGAVGLVVDLAVFTALPQHAAHPLLVRLLSLAVATLVTWRLNRALTFDRSGRRQHAEAIRYGVVTLVAQGTSYAVFAALVLTVLGVFPQGATVIGAAVAAIVSYNGHRLYAFAPVAPRSNKNPDRAVSQIGVLEPGVLESGVLER